MPFSVLRMAVMVLVTLSGSGVPGAEPRGMDELLKALQDRSSYARIQACRELEDLGLDAAPAVPRLIPLLDASDDGARAAADALGAIGKDATAAIPKLVEHLGEGELPRISTNIPGTDMGVSAALALGQMGPDAVPFLIPYLTDKRSAARSNAACALSIIGPAAKDAVTPLIRRVKDRDWLARQCAAEALGSIRSEPQQTIPALMGSLKDKNFNVRRTAASALGAIRPTTPAAVDALACALHDKEGNVQHEAAEALAKLGAAADRAVPTLAERLQSRAMYVDGHPGVCRPVAETVARALGAIGPSAKSALPALLDLLRDTQGTFDRYGPDDRCDNCEARGAVAIAAARIAPHSDDLLCVLGQSLQDDAWIRADVAVALALIGPKAQGQIPSLLRLARSNSDSGNALTFACAAVVIESGETATPDKMLAPVQMSECLSLLPRLSGEDHWALLRTALRRAGGLSRPAIPILIKMLEDPWTDRQDAALALAVFGPEARSAIPVLLAMLASNWGDSRQGAIAALRQIASEDSALLLAGLKHPQAEIRSGVVELLRYFPGAVAVVTEALADPSARVRLAALQSLAKFKDSAKPAIPQIRGLLQAESRTLREAADSALKAIGSADSSSTMMDADDRE